jgi:hypothetical protein
MMRGQASHGARNTGRRTTQRVARPRAISYIGELLLDFLCELFRLVIHW